MNALLSPQPSFLPHQHNATTRRSPTRSMSPFQHGNMSTNRKRKAEDDGDEMSVSPMSSPAIQNRQLSRPSKKSRANEIAGRPLTLPRLLETLDAASLRMVLQKICERQPEIGEEVVKGAPKPSVENALQVLEEYQEKMRAAFPYGNSSSDYVYNRVKAPMAALMDALADFTPQYLPPNETQANVSLQYLDGATKVIHNLPDLENHNCRHQKENAYDEISRAWALVINEAAKRGGGFVLHSGGWDQIVTKHNQQSGGRMGTAMSAMAENVGWVGGGPSGAPQEQQQQHSILNELLSGNYGAPVRVGPW
ncbi:protein DBF8 [Apiospora arundinis]|uniref:Tethering factor for nuclear proteasome STS1 n=1 Tax=Apiospora arundinis TaxID=335852 RepID=A0ABR2JI47_9PEZI